MTLYLRYMQMHVKAALQYRGSFLFQMAASALNPAVNAAAVWFMFWRFDNILGYTLAEVLFLFAVVYIGFTIAETFGRGLDVFDRLIRLGTMDQILTRPRSLILQILGSEFETLRLGRLLVSIWLLNYSIGSLDIAWNAGKAAVLVFALIGSAAVFIGILFLRCALCFFTIEGLELTNILFDGGRETAKYPVSIYDRGFAFVLTFVIPFGCANYFPMLYILEKSDNLLYAFAPVICLFFLVPCVALFFFGVRHYASTGS